MRKLLIPLALFFMSYQAQAQASKQLNTNMNYVDLLSKSLKFYEAQACGPNVSTYSTFSWRGACHTTDGNNIVGTSSTYDLTGGWHDAGDHVKFNFPLAQVVYNMASLYVDYKAQIDAQPAVKTALFKHLDFISDYLIRCHPNANTFVIQVGEGGADHDYWQIPEQNTYTRKSFLANLNKPNTELACSNAAAFAALSMAYKNNGNNNYSATLLQHARDLFAFGYQNQVSYNDNPDLSAEEKSFYDNDNNFYDEIMVGAAWLFRATGETSYSDKASAAFANTYVGGWAPGFGDHQYEATYQMIKASGQQKYKDALKNYVTGIINGTEGNRSPGGMWYVGGSTDGFNLPKSLGAATMAYRYAELVGSSDANYTAARQFAFQQVNYTLGDNPRSRSYVVGYGTNPVNITHHRAASAGDYSTTPDIHTITGALVMGPLGDDSYLNTRAEIKCTEPAIGNNSELALVATMMVKETGGTPPPATGNITVRARGTSGTEQLEIRYKDQKVGNTITLSTTFQEYKVQVDNPAGNFKVAFINDNATRDAVVDWLQVGTVKRQAENRSTNTAVYQNGSCGGSNSQTMNCNGYIDFGSFGSTPSGKVVIRARGTCGSETMVLQVAGTDVKTWTNLSTSFTDYTYDSYSGSKNVKVRFTNDGTTSSGCDKNLVVDKITVCGTAYQAESVTRNGCGAGEWLYCNGNFDFGSVGCSASVASGNSKLAGDELMSTTTHEQFKVYPNPASQQLTVQGSEDYQVTLYDMSGRKVMQHKHLTGAASLDVKGIKPGLYLIKISDANQQQISQRVIIE